jgi:hypothetical protein
MADRRRNPFLAELNIGDLMALANREVDRVRCQPIRVRNRVLRELHQAKSVWLGGRKGDGTPFDAAIARLHAVGLRPKAKTSYAKHLAAGPTLGRFLAACTRTAPGKRVQSSKVYEVFLAWGRLNGGVQWTQTMFSRALRLRGYKRLQSNVVWWLDLELTPTRWEGWERRGRVLGAAVGCPPTSQAIVL